MDTVWIRLTVVKSPTNIPVAYQEHFMFGPTGIVRFLTVTDRTILYRSNDMVAAEVQETDDYIMNILRKVRCTEGRLDGRKKQKTKTSKRKTSSSKKKK